MFYSSFKEVLKGILVPFLIGICLISVVKIFEPQINKVIPSITFEKTK